MSSTTSPASGVRGAEAPPPHVVEDCLGKVQILSDGTVKRSLTPLVLSADDATSPAADEAPVKWKDVVYDEANYLSLRMFVPSTGAKEGKLPLLVFFHGGGFVVCTFAMHNFHNWSLRLAAELPAVVLSADYRLAPEHRLPAAHEDADTLFSWLRAQATSSSDPWLAESADFSRVFISGDSAGGNITHHAAARFSAGSVSIQPARLAGYVLLWPYFGGEDRTASEVACKPDEFLTVPLFDQMWRMALPVGATRDHPAANPFVPGSPGIGDAVDLPPMLVATGDRDMLVDRIRDYVARLRAVGKSVEFVEFAGQAHAFAILKPETEDAAELVRVLRQFVHGGAAAARS